LTSVERVHRHLHFSLEEWIVGRSPFSVQPQMVGKSSSHIGGGDSPTLVGAEIYLQLWRFNVFSAE
jgi:hypothetical protein